MKTLGSKVSRKKILNLLLISIFWSILLSIVLLAARASWAKNFSGSIWNYGIIAFAIIFFISYFSFACRALFYRQLGYDKQYLYYYKASNYISTLKLIINTFKNEDNYQSKIAFSDIKDCEIGWYNQNFRINSFGMETAHLIYFKINDELMIKTDLNSNDEKVIELANLLKSHVKNFNDPYHLVLAMNDDSITTYEYIERIIHNKGIKPNLYK